jgi:selenocysteine-specific elongation factor
VYETLLTELEKEGRFKLEQERILLGGGKGGLSAHEQEVKDKVEALFLKQKFSPPAGEEIKTTFGKDGPLARKMVDMLVVEKKLVKVGPDMCFHRQAIGEIQQSVVDFLNAKGKMTVAEFRDLIGTSRKYALPLIQHFDRLKVTKRVGDDRVLF